jgi:predicted negative regulator of RcsB-dependent stress response
VAQTTKLTHKNVKEMVKHDAFRERTMETVEYVSGHRSQIIKYGAIAVVIVLLAGGFWLYREGQHDQRMNALNDAFKIYNSTVVPAGNPPPFANYWYRTEAEKSAAITKAFSGMADKYGNSDEAMVAHYYMGVVAGDAGNAAEAEKQFKIVVENASKDYASLAKLSLAELYKTDGKLDEGRKLIQSVIDNPTTFVSKEEATIQMARLLEQSKPEEAKKLLEPLRTSMRTGVSQAAIGALGEMLQQK